MAVARIVRSIDAHAGHRFAVAVKSHAAQQRLFFKLPFALIDVEQRRSLVTGNVNVRQAVLVEVACENA